MSYSSALLRRAAGDQSPPPKPSMYSYPLTIQRLFIHHQAVTSQVRPRTLSLCAPHRPCHSERSEESCPAAHRAASCHAARRAASVIPRAALSLRVQRGVLPEPKTLRVGSASAQGDSQQSPHTPTHGHPAHRPCHSERSEESCPAAHRAASCHAARRAASVIPRAALSLRAQRCHSARSEESYLNPRPFASAPPPLRVTVSSHLTPPPTVIPRTVLVIPSAARNPALPRAAPHPVIPSVARNPALLRAARSLTIDLNPRPFASAPPPLRVTVSSHLTPPPTVIPRTVLVIPSAARNPALPRTAPHPVTPRAAPHLSFRAQRGSCHSARSAVTPRAARSLTIDLNPRPFASAPPPLRVTVSSHLTPPPTVIPRTVLVIPSAARNPALPRTAPHPVTPRAAPHLSFRAQRCHSARSEESYLNPRPFASAPPPLRVTVSSHLTPPPTVIPRTVLVIPSAARNPALLRAARSLTIDLNPRPFASAPPPLRVTVSSHLTPPPTVIPRVARIFAPPPLRRSVLSRPTLQRRYDMETRAQDMITCSILPQMCSP